MLAALSKRLAVKKVGAEMTDSQLCQELVNGLNGETSKAKNGHKVKRN